MLNAHFQSASGPLINERNGCAANPSRAPFTTFWREDAAYIDPFLDEWGRDLIAGLLLAAATAVTLLARFFQPPPSRRQIQPQRERHI
jgi:hypothetical protein